MTRTFDIWLSDQRERQDRVGELARAMAGLDDSIRRLQRNPDEHKSWADLITMHGEREHVFAFNQAWREYQSTREEMAESAAAK